ncbi:type IV toxin-antitoxin system AbiEi family antitoxin domain-containing protein [Nocardioides sambongensis]|uniref:type IV toxin-antitoxin system AbiEi family antitoxin domain-containing protein n=1 Tax=Nocardioides sambongensis TaxID=2589074 RepID=UPI0011297CE1|nr:type IV toxin-antitoxin system AbiEi family antitoxin domain-containing protein [Nocardioides sambongensis]
MDLSALPRRPFTLPEAEALGVSRRQVAKVAERGLLIRYARGVYAVPGLPDTIELRTAVVELATSQHHVITDRTAAWLHGVDAYAMDEHDLLPPIETCVLRGRNPTRREQADGRTRDLAAEDLMRLGGLRVTTPLRTALDLGCHLRQRDAFAAMCALAGKGGFEAGDLLRELPRFRRRRGVVQCRQLAPWTEPRTESAREAWVLFELRSAGLPAPVAQLWVEVEGVARYRLDLAYPHARVCVEYDGEHHLDPAQRRRDLERRTHLAALGWTVIVVRRGDFTGPRLDRWVREVRQALQPTYGTRRW